MDYENIILNKLLDKYETSKSMISDCNRSIILKVDKMAEYDIENYEEKKLFNDVVIDLESKGLISFKWKQHEKR